MKLLTLVLATATDAILNKDCLDQDKAALCADDCTEVFLVCLAACGSDNNCIMQCSRDSVDCTELCPCYDNCPNGCPCTYANDYCSTTEETCHLQNEQQIVECDEDAYVKFWVLFRQFFKQLNVLN